MNTNDKIVKELLELVSDLKLSKKTERDAVEVLGSMRLSRIELLDKISSIVEAAPKLDMFNLHADDIMTLNKSMIDIGEVLKGE